MSVPTVNGIPLLKYRTTYSPEGKVKVYVLDSSDDVKYSAYMAVHRTIRIASMRVDECLPVPSYDPDIPLDIIPRHKFLSVDY